MFHALARYYPMKVTRAQLGTLSQFTASGGTFGAYFSNLKRHALIEEHSGEVEITKAGMEFLGTDVPPRQQTTADLLELWRGRCALASARCSMSWSPPIQLRSAAPSWVSAPATPPAAERSAHIWSR
jgi:hypothetical protein